MKVISGHFAELRVYLGFVAGLFSPGRELPVFAQPDISPVTIPATSETDLKLIIEEGRRQLDRQRHDLDNIRDRAGRLLSLSLAEVALLAASTRFAWSGAWCLTVIWAIASILAFFSAAGAASILAGSASLGRMDTRDIARRKPPLLHKLAAGYSAWCAIGEETVRTFLTVLRDAVFLAILAALVFAPVFVLTR